MFRFSWFFCVNCVVVMLVNVLVVELSGKWVWCEVSMLFLMLVRL